MTAMITLKEKIGYGLGDMASSMFWKLFGSYLMIFYTDVFGLPAAVVGTMFLITRVWDSAFDPIVGVIADRTQTRWGKFRPYLLYLAVPFALIGIFTFTTPELNDTGKLVYAYITYSLMMMVWVSRESGILFSCNTSSRNVFKNRIPQPWCYPAFYLVLNHTTFSQIKKGHSINYSDGFYIGLLYAVPLVIS